MSLLDFRQNFVPTNQGTPSVPQGLSLSDFIAKCLNAGLGSGNQETAYQVALYLQASVETGHFTSRIYRDEKNMFGMRPSKVRTKYYSSISKTNNGEFASYDSLIDSIQDRVDLDRYNGVAMPTGISLSELLVWLDKVLAKGYVPAGSERTKYRNLFINVYNRFITSGEDDGLQSGNGLGKGDSGDGLDAYDQEGSFGFGSGNGLFKLKLFGIPLLLLALGGYIYFKFIRK